MGHDHEANCLLQEISHVLKNASIKFGHPSIVWTCSSLLSFEKWINIIEVHFVCGNCILIYFALNFMPCEYVCYTPLYKHSVISLSHCISYWVDYSNNITNNCFRTSYVLLSCFWLFQIKQKPTAAKARLSTNWLCDFFGIFTICFILSKVQLNGLKGIMLHLISICSCISFSEKFDSQVTQV